MEEREVSTPEEQRKFIRIFMVPLVGFSIIATYFGVTGYFAPLQSFQSYLAELPPGYSSILNNTTYIFYFQTQYAIQAVVTALSTIMGIWAFIYPHRAMAKFDGLLIRLHLEDKP